MTAVAQDTARAIRPFRVDVPDEALADMRRRIAATVWPERETVPDTSQGVPLAVMQELTRYWATDYDWRACEARLNARPQFTTEIDGVRIHFIHVRSRHENALLLIMTYFLVEAGYPGLAYFNEVDKGGHFAAWEEPELFTDEVRATFRSVR